MHERGTNGYGRCHINPSARVTLVCILGLLALGIVLAWAGK